MKFRSVRMMPQFGACVRYWFTSILELGLFLYCLPLIGGPAEPLDTWRRRTNFVDYYIRSIAFGDGQFVGVGQSDLIFSSSDGVRWRGQSLGATLAAQSVAFGNGKFVAARLLGGLLTSADATNWIPHNPSPLTELQAVAFCEDLFVAVGTSIGRGAAPAVLTSSEGVNWKEQLIGEKATLRGIAFGNGLYVTVGRSNSPGAEPLIFTSPDSETWSPRTPPNSSGLYSVVFGNGVFVALAEDQIVRSTNGIHWTVSTVLPADGFLYGLTFGENLFTAVGHPGVILTSPDGITWTLRQSGTQQTLLGVATGDGRIVVGGDQILQSDPLRSAPPLVLQPPRPQAIRVRASYTNSVIAEYPGPLTYQWQVNGTNVPGETNAVILLTNVHPSLSGMHSVVVTSDGGSTTSALANVVVAFPVTIVVQPVGQAVPAGGSATFSVVAAGTPPFGFRWRRNGSPVYRHVLDQGICFLTITNAQAGADYTVAVTNIVSPLGLLSSVASLVVLPDTDRDGLPDDFEVENHLDPNDKTDATADTDNDGMSNVAEYDAGTNFRDGRSCLKIERISATNGARIHFRAEGGRTYTVQYTDDVAAGTWSRLADVPARAKARNLAIADPAASVVRTYRLVTPRQP